MWLPEFNTLAPVELANRTFTRAQLDRLAAKAAGVLSSIFVNYESGTIEVGVDSDTESTQVRAAVHANVDSLITQRTQIAAVSGADAVAVTKLFDFTIADTAPRIAVVESSPIEVQESDYTAPMRGGKRLTVLSSNGAGGACSSGFLVDGSGGRYIMTAGHCGPVGTQVWIGSPSNPFVKQYGNLQNNTFWRSPVQNDPVYGTTDVALTHVPATSPDLATPSVYVNSALQRPVVASTNVIHRYRRACVQGAKTRHEVCGRLKGNLTDQYPSLVSPSPEKPLDGNSHVLTYLIAWIWDEGTDGVQSGDSGAPFYSVNPDGTAVAYGILSGIRTNETRVATMSEIIRALTQTGTTLGTVGRPPFAAVDLVAGKPGEVEVSGWIIDPDLPATPTDVHIYLGGPAGSGDGFARYSGYQRYDVADAYPGSGPDHGFHYWLPTNRRGWVSVYIYAIDIGGGPHVSPLIYSGSVWVS